MKFKKVLLKGAVALASVLVLGGFAGVASAEDAKLQDGEYTAVTNIDEHGWALKHTIVIKDGKISESKVDYVNDKGEMKSENAEYNKNMKEKAGIEGKEAMAKLDAALVEKQSADVEVVTGATSTSNKFKFSAAVLLKAAEEGKTGEINLDELPLQDGEYTLETLADERGWKHVFTLVVKDGKVTESKYDMTNADGKLKSEDADYNKAMADKAGVSFADAVKKLNEELVAKQSADVEVVSGATNTTDAFKTYAAKLLQAAKLGATETIKVDLVVE